MPLRPLDGSIPWSVPPSPDRGLQAGPQGTVARVPREGLRGGEDRGFPGRDPAAATLPRPCRPRETQ